MNPIAKEISSYLGSAEMTDEEFIEHYGRGHLDGGHSGRYKWGTGDDSQQHEKDFIDRIDELKKNGWVENAKNIKKEFGITTNEYRIEKSLCNDERRMAVVSRAKNLRDNSGYGPTEIGRRMGVGESTVRSWFNKEAESKMMRSKKTAEFLKEQVDKKRMVDVGVGTEIELGNISREKLNTALYLLERDGYHVYGGGVPQPTNKNQQTNLRVLCSPDVKHNEIFQYDKIQTIKDYITKDSGDTFEKKFTYPSSLDSKRLKIRYKEDGGESKDGVIELRRGVDDLSLGNSRYSQVRILVDGTHYLKGMAIYSDDMPEGIDVIFNTNKGKDKSIKEVLKKIKDDPENPFGSAIKDSDQGGQYWYKDKNGEKKLGLINKRADEGDWTEWSNNLPSQFLSKQSQSMAKKQLDLAKANKDAELDEIMSLNNPTIKKYYLDKFASSCDSAAVDLKAAALPGQKYHVIIPNNTLKDNEIYAPGYESGTKLALVRYPHGGIFEIPVCTVNNKNALGEKLIGKTSIDAVCINSKVASQLSGADFDGDTVMCIPTHDKKGKVKISSQPALKELKNFSPDIYSYDKAVTDDKGVTHYYRNGKEFKLMNTNLKQTKMGEISNLITDMTLFGANTEDIAKAVKHSMVVIDAEKHKYDYKQSYIDNEISRLQREWQPKFDKNGNLIRAGGASTIISKSKGKSVVDKRKGEGKPNIKGKPWYDPNRPEGSLIYSKADDKDLYYVQSKYDKKTGIKTIKTMDGKTVTYNMNDKHARDKYDPVMKKDKNGVVYYTNKSGDIKYRFNKRTYDSTKMAETDDAMTLVSQRKHPMELIYADYANNMKSLANKARIEIINTGNLKYNPNSKNIYAKEVSSLNYKLKEALKNTVKERTATRLASAEIKNKQNAYPDMTSGELKKLSQKTLSKYREKVGSISRKERSINITDKEWEAIQAGAISENILTKILNNSDPDILRERAMPKNKNALSTAQIRRIQAMNNSNYTLAQIANAMNISTSSVIKYLKGVD